MITQLVYLSLCLMMMNCRFSIFQQIKGNQNHIENIDDQYLVNNIKEKIEQKYKVDGSDYLNIIRIDQVTPMHYVVYVKYSHHKVFSADFQQSEIVNVNEYNQQNRMYMIGSQTIPHKHYPLSKHINGYRPMQYIQYNSRSDRYSHLAINGSGIGIPVNNPPTPGNEQPTPGNNQPTPTPPIPDNNTGNKDKKLQWPDWMPKPPQIPDIGGILFPQPPTPMPI